VTERLEGANIPYMLSGSMAASFYARPRMTRDIDLVVEIVGNDVETIVQLFEKDFYIDPDMVREAAELRGMFNVIHLEHIIKVDFIVKKDNPYRITEFQRRRRYQIDDFAVWIVAPEDLILSKLVWARDSRSEMQLNDVKVLLRYLRGQIDMDYLLHWAEKIGVIGLLEEMLGNE